MMLECGDGQTKPIRQLLENQNWVVEQIVQDYTQRPRIVIAHQ
jgi:methylase of polypeptide subunit release factors